MEALDKAGPACDEARIDNPELPRWTHTFDHAQAGVNRKGAWVVWDYASYEDVVFPEEQRKRA